MRYVPAIDGLRAVAVLAVVAYHLGLPVPAGFIGVDVFFVISGYLITRLLRDELGAGGIDLWAFYARRAKRLLPALAVVLVATLLAGFYLLPAAGHRPLLESAAAASLFGGNLYFMGMGYFDGDAAQMPLLHLWSLGVEEQFYLLWPLVLILARRRLVLAVGLIAAASFALAQWELSSDSAFYLMPARAWELAVGALVALRPVRLPTGAAWAGLALTLGAVFVPMPTFPGVGAVPAVAGAALVIAAAQAGRQPWILTNRAMVGVGLVSYSLYLWHWPVIVLLADWHWALQGLLSLALAVASYWLVERPTRQMRAPNRTTVLGALCGVVALAAVPMSIARTMPPAKRADVAREKTLYEMGCDRWHKDAQLTPCWFGSESAPRKAVLIGDSVTAQWFPAVSRALPASNWRLLVLTKSGCPMVDEPIHYDRIKRRYTECEQWRADALKFANAYAPDLLIFSNSSTYDYTPEQWTEGTRRVLAQLPDAGQIVAIRPTWSQGKRSDVGAVGMAEALAQVPGARMIDLNGLVCPGGECPESNYSDANHITPELSASLADEMAVRLRTRVPTRN